MLCPNGGSRRGRPLDGGEREREQSEKEKRGALPSPPSASAAFVCGKETLDHELFLVHGLETAQGAGDDEGDRGIERGPQTLPQMPAPHTACWQSLPPGRCSVARHIRPYAPLLSYRLLLLLLLLCAPRMDPSFSGEKCSMLCTPHHTPPPPPLRIFCTACLALL